jgi:hypothetical protein
MRDFRDAGAMRDRCEGAESPCSDFTVWGGESEHWSREGGGGMAESGA